MLRALGTPLSFLGLLVGFLLAVVVQAYASAFAARILGDRAAYRRLGGIRRVLDPFGAVAAALGGLGWGVLPEMPLRSRGRLALRGDHGLVVDRGRIVREAVAVVLADLDAKGESSILVRRLRES